MAASKLYVRYQLYSWSLGVVQAWRMCLPAQRGERVHVVRPATVSPRPSRTPMSCWSATRKSPERGTSSVSPPPSGRHSWPGYGTRNSRVWA